MQSSSQPIAAQNRERLPVLEQRASRRTFTRNGLFALLGAFLATSAVGTVKMLYPNRVLGFGAKVTAGTAKEIMQQLQVNKFVRNNEGRFYILPATADSAIAVYWKCVHLGCTVPAPSPALEGNIQCPCHGSLYKGNNGDLIHGPATRPLDYMPITIDNGNVVVDTGKVTTRTSFEDNQATKLA